MIWFRCLKDIRDTMQRWSGRSWNYMLVHQGKFEAEINYCDVQLSACFTTFMVSTLYPIVKICLTVFQAVSQMELLVRQEDERWKGKVDGDGHKDLMRSAPISSHGRNISQLSNHFHSFRLLFFLA